MGLGRLKSEMKWTALIVAGCTLVACSHIAATHSEASDGPTYRLPSDGSKPGEPMWTALLFGPFEAAMTPKGPCAWLGTQEVPTLWPAGYGVRFSPTELVGPHGQIVARAGQRLSFGGGVMPSGPTAASYCGQTDDQTVALMG